GYEVPEVDFSLRGSTCGSPDYRDGRQGHAAAEPVGRGRGRVSSRCASATEGCLRRNGRADYGGGTATDQRGSRYQAQAGHARLSTRQAIGWFGRVARPARCFLLLPGSRGPSGDRRETQERSHITGGDVWRSW